MLMDAKNVVSRENDRPRVRDTNGKLNTDLVLWFSIWQVIFKYSVWRAMGHTLIIPYDFMLIVKWF